MFTSLINFLRRLKSGTEELNYGRDIIARWVREHCSKSPEEPSVLDIGLGQGDDLVNIREACQIPLRLHGIECYPPNVTAATARGIHVASLDIERDRFPYEDATFDVVVANQIIEHTKEIFFIFAEIARVLKPEGVAIIGVPNLASLHNRIALLFGLQPTCIQVLGPHVRGFTRGSFKEFAEVGGFFQLEGFAGSNFYPFPAFISRWLAKVFPAMAVGSFYLLRRTTKAGSFVEVLEQTFFETPYYRGPPRSTASAPGQLV